MRCVESKFVLIIGSENSRHQQLEIFSIFTTKNVSCVGKDDSRDHDAVKCDRTDQEASWIGNSEAGLNKNEHADTLCSVLQLVLCVLRIFLTKICICVLRLGSGFRSIGDI